MPIKDINKLREAIKAVVEKGGRIMDGADVIKNMSKIMETIRPEYVEFVPEQLESGVLYISEKYGIAIHLCACGCGGKTVTPLGHGEWQLTKNGEVVTLRPSIGNWSGENPYHAHYYITNNKIEWL